MSELRRDEALRQHGIFWNTYLEIRSGLERRASMAVPVNSASLIFVEPVACSVFTKSMTCSLFAGVHGNKFVSVLTSWLKAISEMVWLELNFESRYSKVA